MRPGILMSLLEPVSQSFASLSIQLQQKQTTYVSKSSSKARLTRSLRSQFFRGRHPASRN